MQHYKETVEIIYDFSKRYWKDLIEFKDYSLFDFLAYVKSLPYWPDLPNIETINRPKFTIQKSWGGPKPTGYESRDCDDKTLLVSGFFEMKRQLSRSIGDDQIAVVGQEIDPETGKPYPHHIYPEMQFPKTHLWIPADTTYPHRGQVGTRLYNEIFREVYPRPA